MYSPARLCCVLSLAMLWSSSGWSATKAKPGARKPAKEISADDGLQKQMDWENKLLGPNTEKKIDLVKIQKLQAEETARREKQDKLDRVERDRKEREAALAAQRRDVKAPSSREVPAVVEAPVPARPVEKHDDAFVDKLLKDGKSGYSSKKRPTVSNDDVDELLAKAKQDKGASIAPRPAKGGKTDSVDQLLATADKQQAIKTTTKKPSDAEPVSAELAARESALKAMALAATKAQQDRDRSKRLSIPDAAMLRAPQQTASREDSPAVPARAPATAPRAGAREDRDESDNGAEARREVADHGGWKDPFASEPASPPRGAKISSTTVVPASVRPASGARHAPAFRPTGDDGDPAPASAGGKGAAGASDWKDPFDSAGGVDGAGTKARPASPKAKPAKPRKRPPHWKDPFA